MEILGAAVTIRGEKNDMQSYLDNCVTDLARLALEQARYLPSEVDLVVSLSISPNRVAEDVAIAGPRFTHQGKRDLRAQHAAVFDLLDADWTLALDLTQSHCHWLGYRSALVIRTKALKDVEHVGTSGFADGARATVLTPGRNSAGHVSSYADLGGLGLASVTATPARRAERVGLVARLKGRFDTGFGADQDDSSVPILTVVEDVRNRVAAPVSVLFHESWLDEAAAIGGGFMYVEGARGLPNPFQSPAWFADCVCSAEPARNGEQTVASLTLNVFRQRVACCVMEV
ncbi:hypothetical protein D1006_35165 [Burkholderia stabilis]|uniref:Uncharacterized protein n=1 Tax=Burkholderia stabilis TaxID=95485 RepID=A0A4Q2A7W2_9BURK|nr:hypothetical protein [Burkholderia stabilis]RXV65337.1 hypothetical protein D1006_35165 [Burkholderia stabilis]